MSRYSHHHAYVNVANMHDRELGLLLGDLAGLCTSLEVAASEQQIRNPSRTEVRVRSGASR